MADLFAHLTTAAWDAPATHLEAITFSGAPVTLDAPCRWFVVGTAGNVKVTTTGGETGEFYALAGVRYDLRVTTFHHDATATAATSIVAFW